MNVFIAFKIIRIFLIIIYCNNAFSIKGEHYNEYISFSSKITIKINSSGRQQILSSYYSIRVPNSIIINGVQTNQISKELTLNESPNIIELTCNTDFTTCSKMFYKCSSILEVDLSQFNEIKVTQYNNMFEDCFSLTSINILNLDTSSANDMSYMFLNCPNIISLDLSSLNIQSVTTMSYMFSGCKSLKYLNLSNSNTSLICLICLMIV